MKLADDVLEQVTRLLSASIGTTVSITRSAEVTSGWSARATTSPWPWITRCYIQAEAGSVPASVIVKVRHLAQAHSRSEAERFYNEHAALEFLTMSGSAAGPRLIAADNEAGILIIEDLGSGPALEDLLVESDAALASDGLVMFASTLGRMHAATSGYAEQYYQLRRRYGPVDSTFDRISILGIDLEQAFRRLQEITVSSPYLPPAVGVESDVDEILRVLAEPGPFLAFSNGDACPANCRMVDKSVRFFDFEHAGFRHALLDVAALRIPFPACACWSNLPEEAYRRAEDAYRKEMALCCPAILDPVIYAHGITVACAAWTILRATRLPKLEQVDVPHPMGFSRRGQLLDLISTTVSCAQQSHSLQSLASWLASVRDILRVRWPTSRCLSLSIQPFSLAFRDLYVLLEKSLCVFYT